MILLDHRDRRPIYEQITERFEELILSGVLKKDDQLPSVRSLAMELSINPNTIQRAYTELERAGYIYSVKGKGNFVEEMKDALELKRQEVIKKVQETAREALLLSMEKERLMKAIEQIYSEGEDQS